MSVIYVRTNKFNGKQYVGQATNLEVRESDWECLTQPYAGKAINNARAKYGIEAFGFEILKECDDKELDFWEKYYIKELNTKVPNGYNMTDGGEGGNTYICKNEKEMNKIKQKISESNKGEKNHMYGKHHTEETRKKISERNKNGKWSKTVIQIDKSTYETIAEFPSASEAERQLGYSQANISRCCRGKIKSAYGFIWKYKEESAA